MCQLYARMSGCQQGIKEWCKTLPMISGAGESLKNVWITILGAYRLINSFTKASSQVYASVERMSGC
jgi:hypothetical protein